MADKETMEIRIGFFQQLRNMLTQVDAKNKTSRIFLDAVIAEMDRVLEPYENTEKEGK